MTHEHLIFLGFAALVLALFVFVVKKGVHSRPCFFCSVGAVFALCLIAFGIHNFLSGNASLFEVKDLASSSPDIILGLLFLGLASAGCLCAESKNERDSRH